METNFRRNLSGLSSSSERMIIELLKNGPAFNVWQAVLISENITKGIHPNRKEFLLEQTGLNFRPSEKYEFPPHDIKCISFHEDIITFDLTFLGLYGINSPLPRCYHEQVAVQQRTLGTGEIPLQNFFDIFNNRFYWLYYQSWKKYRFYLFLNGDRNNKIVERINSFTGRGLFSKVKETFLEDFALLKFSGILAQRVRNKAGLKILLAYLFPDFKMKVKEHVPRWIELNEVPSLGEDECKLGENTYIGKYVIDFMTRICIQIGPVSFEEYLNFLPGTKLSKKLIELLKIYLNDGLEFDLEFIVKADSIVMISWDDERLKLGSTLWLGKPELDQIKVNINYEELIIN